MAGCGSGQLPGATPDSDSDSDNEGLRPLLQVIHSGHFMVSSPHNDDRHRRKEAESPGNVPASSIDPTLTRLFECMSLAYSGKLVSPKWKNFKGLRLLWRDKIRLNNAIWRAWYLQYVEKRKTPVCGFVTPLDGSEGDDHRKPEAVVLEGNYWKRRIEVVMKEYNKWRIYYKKRLNKHHQDGKRFQEKKVAPSWRCSEMFAACSRIEEARGKEDDMLFYLDCFLTDTSDTLFTTTHGQPFAYQYPDFDYVGNADMIQPELATLQPNLDDFMDISDFFGTPRPLPSQQPPVCFQEPPFYNSFNEGMNSQPHSAIVCNRALQPSTSYIPRSDHCFLNTPLSSNYNSSAVTCSLSNPEAKPLSHYPEPDDRYTTDSYPPPASVPLQCISSNLPVQDQDLLFPHVSCPKPPYSTVTTENTILNQAAPPTIHADVYPLYNEPSTQIETPHVFPMPKDCARVSVTKPRRHSAEGATRSLCSISQPCISASKPDSSAQLLPSCGPNGLSNTTGSRSEAMSFPGISVQSISSPPTQSGLGFPSPPPAIFLSPVLCSPSNSTVSETTNMTGPPLLPKTERLSPSSVCSDDRKDTLTVPCAQNSHTWNKSNSKKVESRRITHISAEQKRRCNIKIGFDTLHSLVTSLHGQHSNKLSKATTLHKTAEYICKLQQERAQLQEEAQRLRHQVQELSDSINLCQQQLPASGVPVTHQHFQHMRQMFQNYVQSRTLQNWKFWLFSLLIRPLFDSFNRMVSTSSMTDLRETAMDWLDQHCSLPALRPTVLSSLCQLSTSTSILTDPSLMPEQAVQAVTRGESGDNFY
ncbi:PREDICTED: carbohydrate-responsive element-binding protein [Nanorana parkeri]|uniref:carbohydrate-responsive element-binding protein n=1 Tax=Nanorana parkeri TaxID=125878 RepID=UPI000854EDC3|nr:PREDICTED: carbohydrate-responsive element-binding protein [Nanorana parkeri]